MSQKPSVGRIVHFHDHSPDAGVAIRAYAAIVVGVRDDVVDLFVMWPDNFGIRPAVREGDAATHGTWSWPPHVPPTKET